RHNRCADGPRKRPILVLKARYPRSRPGLASWIKPRKGIAMEPVRRYALLSGGEWVDTEDQFEIRSPATEELVASVAKGGREHSDRAVAAAKAAPADGPGRVTPPAPPAP